MPQITFTNNTIKKILKEHQLTENRIENTITEYVWNGFDAEATTIEIDLELGGSDFAGEPSIRKLIIKDNGYGIDFYKLDNKFKPFYDSEKALMDIEDRHHSTLHGKNGIGRLAFSAFANQAKWTTIFRSNGKKRLKYDITISDEKVGEYSPSDLYETKDNTGTIVEFSNFKRLRSHNSGYKPLFNALLNYLIRAFGWYLELHKEQNFQIFLNGKPLEYYKNINDSDEFTISYPESDIVFNVRYIQWDKPLADEFSRFYYLGKGGTEKYKETTKLNKKGDSFYHSVYIQSDYFDDFAFEPIERVSTSKGRSDVEFKYLDKEIKKYLRNKRKPFLRKHSNLLIEEFEKQGYIDRKNKTDLELIEIDDLETVLKEIYVTEPRVFHELSPQQITTLIGLFRLILNSEERENVLYILEKVVELDSEERQQLSRILKITDLNKVIKTLDLILERIKLLNILKEIVFKPEYGANERDHLQRIVGPNYWIFGEQYNLVSDADDDFEKALRNHLYIIRGVKKDVWMADPDKKDRVDIFLCRQDRHTDSVHNVLVELKHPTSVGLGEGEYSQIMRYMQIIIHEPQFNADSYTWDFYLIGSKFNTSGYIESILENNKSKGVLGLALEVGKYRIFIKKWSDVISQCELRHEFLNKKLQVKKEKLVESLRSADEAVKIAEKSSALSM